MTTPTFFEALDHFFEGKSITQALNDLILVPQRIQEQSVYHFAKVVCHCDMLYLAPSIHIQHRTGKRVNPLVVWG